MLEGLGREGLGGRRFGSSLHAFKTPRLRAFYNPLVRDYPVDDPAAPTLVLGHGAGAGQDHPWMTRVGRGLAERGIRVVTFNFPYMEAGRGVPDPGPVLEEAFQSIWQKVAADAHGPLFAGGKSMGGRIASQAAARGALGPSPAGLVFFGYPLHPPGNPQQRRDRHLPKITAPMLYLHGTRDPFGSPDEMKELVAGLAGATLELVDGGNHSLERPKKADPDGRSLDNAIDVTANWILTSGTRRSALGTS